MTENENKQLGVLETRVKGVEINLDELSKQVKIIRDNDLPHLNLKLNITLGGLVFIAIMIAILGIIITMVIW